jgi:alginate O-acetyltransferase complex protein AlgI
MLFDSLAYILYFPAVLLLYQFAPDRQRWIVLLAASLVFYAALGVPLLLVALGGVVAVSYRCGLAVAAEHNEARRRRLLWSGVLANIAILCTVKYSRALAQIWTPGIPTETQFSSVLVTVGVSFYTLQAISYLTDIYLKTAEAESHCGYFALYLSFFPKLLQGPIERTNDLLPQFKTTYHCTYENLRSGTLIFAWGLFKKLAVANRLASYVNTVYGDVRAYSGITLILATYMYAIQIFADFSGYSDMAIGVARMFNIRLSQNFNAPYFATSVSEFWRRWHISFSRWLLDYIFKPLQMGLRNARSFGTAAALMGTFLLSGLWHGASWTFAVWGLLHGLFLTSSVLLMPWRNRCYERMGLHNHPVRYVVQVVLTFNCVAFAWIFFRANSLPDALYISTHLLSGVGGYLVAVATHLHQLTHLKYLWDPLLMEKGLPSFVLLIIALVIMLLVDPSKHRMRLQERPWPVRWSTYYLLALAISYLAAYDDVGFVYFQF